MKSFQKVFSKLEKNCSLNCDQVVQLNDFLPVFLLSMSLCRRMGNIVFFYCVVPVIWVFLNQNLDIFYGFPKKKIPMSIPITSTLGVSSPAPPPPGIFCSVECPHPKNIFIHMMI